jgi:hypothetical protein
MSKTCDNIISIILVIGIIILLLKYVGYEYFTNTFDYMLGSSYQDDYIIPDPYGRGEPNENQTPVNISGREYRNPLRLTDQNTERLAYGMDLTYPKNNNLYELTDTVRRPIVQYKSSGKKLPPVSKTTERTMTDWSEYGGKTISGENNATVDSLMFNNVMVRQ